MSAPRILSLCAMAYVIAGCSGMSEQACVTADWRTVGFEDGTGGRSVGNIGSYRNACAEHGVAPDLEAYRAGHAEGVQVYCRESNGFAVGHSGATYQGVCPADLEARVRRRVQLGPAFARPRVGVAQRRLADREQLPRARGHQARADVDRRDDDRERHDGRAARRDGDAQRRSRAAATVELTTEIQQLERDRALAERDLLEYRGTLAATL